MTLVVGAAAPNFSIIGADRRVQVGSSHSGSFTPGEADKLFEVDQLSVASFGMSPPGENVPALVRNFIGAGLQGPGSLAHALFQKIKGLSDPGNFGLLIAGSGAMEPELWEVSKQGKDCVRLSAGVLHERGELVGVQGETVLTDGESTRERVLEILQQGARQHPQWVGPPYEISLIRYGQPLLKTRVTG